MSEIKLYFSDLNLESIHTVVGLGWLNQTEAETASEASNGMRASKKPRTLEKTFAFSRKLDAAGNTTLEFKL